MKYDVTIGLEIHLETKTKTKMFSGAPSNFNTTPNMNIQSLDLGEPGSLPTVNKEAVRKAIMMCHVLHMEIDSLLRFDRKNYFYADLPKGYQITQQDYPIGSGGYVLIHLEDGQEKRIELERLHMEEDTAKQIHFADYTLLDYNRSGTPLVEIVTKPVIQNGYEAMKYVEKIRSIAQFLNISDGKMEEGSLRCDVNISLKPEGSKTLGTKVEIKNLNSIANVRKAIEFEIERQSTILDENGEIFQETRRFDESIRGTVLMRLKTDAVDYKYFRETNILPIQLSETFIKETIEGAPEGPDEKYSRYTKEYKLNHLEASKILENMAFTLYFDEIAKLTRNYREAYNFLKGEVSAYVNAKEISFNEVPIKKEDLAKLFDYLGEGKINNKSAREFFEKMLNGAKIEKLYEESQKNAMSEDDIRRIVLEVLKENEQSIIDYKNGKDRAFGFLVGQVMKKSQGKADPQVSNGILRDELNKNL